MAHLDWSDPDMMFDMFTELVTDARQESEDDPERLEFLAGLEAELLAAQTELADASREALIARLLEIEDGLGAEFEDDPVTEELRACIESLSHLEEEGLA